MNYVCMSYLNPDNTLPALIWMIIVIVYMFFPLNSIYKHFVKSNVDVFENMYKKEIYEDMAPNFVDDYDRANPATVAEGWQWLADLVERKENINQERISQIRRKIQRNSQARLTGMKKYAAANRNLNDYNKYSIHKTRPRVGSQEYIDEENKDVIVNNYSQQVAPFPSAHNEKNILVESLDTHEIRTALPRPNQKENTSDIDNFNL